MYKIYQIEYGDTLDLIALKTNTTIDELKRINGINNNYDISVGELIIVPNNDNEMFSTYIVNTGETLWSIAQSNNIDIDTLLKLNGLDEKDYIYPNQEIIIPNSNVDIYITKYNDTVQDVLSNLGVDIATLANENNKIFVVEDQLMLHKKEKEINE